MKETQIQNQICEYLALKGYFFFRSNNIPVYSPKDKIFRRMPKYGMLGVPDIILILTCKNIGVMVGLEVKKEKTYQSKSQKQFQKELEEVGGFYFIVRSIDDCIKAIKDVDKKVQKMW